jgi:hypothetical protein
VPTDTPVRRWPAMGLGVLFASVTAAILLEDVIAGAPPTVDHAVAISGVVAAIAAGHYAWPAIRRGAILPGLILCVVAVAATAYVVVSAGARNATRAASAGLAAAHASGARAEAERAWRRLSDERGRLGTPRTTQAVRAAMDAVVGPGEGQVPVRVFRATRECTDITREGSAAGCRPLLTLRMEMAAAIRLAEIEPQVSAARARLEALPDRPAPATGWSAAGAVLAAIPGVSAPPDAIAARLALLMPWAGVVIGELAAIAFLSLAFGSSGGRTEGRTVRRSGTWRETMSVSRETTRHARRSGSDAGNRGSDGPAGRSGADEVASHARDVVRDAGRGVAGRTVGVGPDKAACLAALVTDLALGRTVPSQRALAERWGRPKQTVSDWLGEWEASGLIPPRRTVGRAKALVGTG